MYNFTKEEIKNVIDESRSMTEASKKLGVKYDTFKRYATKFNLFETNQSGKGTIKPKKYKNKDFVFKKGNEVPTKVLKYWLNEERDWCCEECGIEKWNGKDISLEIDHIDGNRQNNELCNLKILCPNCHSQTPTWRGRGINGTNKHKKKVSDEELIKAIKTSKSIIEALIKVNLAPKGGNYKRAYNLSVE